MTLAPVSTSLEQARFSEGEGAHLSVTSKNPVSPELLPARELLLRALTGQVDLTSCGRAVARGQLVVDGQMLGQPRDGQQAANLLAGPEEDDSRA